MRHWTRCVPVVWAVLSVGCASPTVLEMDLSDGVGPFGPQAMKFDSSDLAWVSLPTEANRIVLFGFCPESKIAEFRSTFKGSYVAVLTTHILVEADSPDASGTPVAAETLMVVHEGTQTICRVPEPKGVMVSRSGSVVSVAFDTEGLPTKEVVHLTEAEALRAGVKTKVVASRRLLSIRGKGSTGEVSPPAYEVSHNLKGVLWDLVGFSDGLSMEPVSEEQLRRETKAVLEAFRAAFAN